MNNKRAPIISIVVLVLTSFGIGPASATTSGAAGDEDLFYLSVQLNDVYNPDLRIRLPVSTNKPFQITVENGDVRTEISGVVHDPNDGKYPLTLKASEWASEKNNIAGTTEMQLELDRPSASGVIFSVGYLRTVTLSKRNSIKAN